MTVGPSSWRLGGSTAEAAILLSLPLWSRRVGSGSLRTGASSGDLRVHGLQCTGWMDEDGERSDWLEVTNLSAQRFLCWAII